ncbi:hypothetical protein Pmar_PMAR027180, partial [Perkinsus marinus ATCC 50983]
DNPPQNDQQPAPSKKRKTYQGDVPPSGKVLDEGKFVLTEPSATQCKSARWANFSKILCRTTGDEVSCVACCNTCKVVVPRPDGTTAAMRTHVCKRAENQTRITHFIPTADVSDEQKRSIREAALVLLSEIGISYLSFESPAMINFVRVISSVGAKLGSPLDAQRVLPSETTLRRDMVKLAQSRQQDLKIMISKQRRPLQ